MLVSFCVDYRIKPHVPPFDKIPANSVEFQSCDCTTQVQHFMLILLKINVNLLQYKLLGFQILFTPYTFIYQL